MKTWFVLLALTACLAGCDSATGRSSVAVEEEVQATPPPAKKPGNWMWDKTRGNPLEAGPHSKAHVR